MQYSKHEASFGTPGPEAGPKRPTEVPGLLRGIRRRWFLGSCVGLLIGGIAAAAYFYSQPTTYTTFATVYISPFDENVLPTGQQDRFANEELKKSQAGLLKSRNRLQEVIGTKEFSAMGTIRNQVDSLAWLEKELKVLVLDGGFLRVSLTGENVDELAKIVNAIVDSYLLEANKLGDEEKENRLTKLAASIREWERRVQSDRDQLSVLAKRSRGSDSESLSFLQKQAIETANRLKGEEAAAQKTLRAAKASLAIQRARAGGDQSLAVLKSVVQTFPLVYPPDVAKAARPPAVSPEAIQQALDADRPVQDALAAVATARGRLAVAKETYEPGAPKLAELEGDIRKAEAKVEAVRNGRRREVLGRLQEFAISEAIREMNDTIRLIATTDLQLAQLKGLVEEANREAEAVAVRNSEIDSLRNKIAASDLLLADLRRNHNRLELDIGAELRQLEDPKKKSKRIRLLHHASANAARPSTSTLNMSIGLGVVGFLAGLLGIGYLEGRTRRLVNAADVSRALDLRALGTMPTVPGLGETAIQELIASQHGMLGNQLLEAVNDIRAMLVCGTWPHGRQVMLITSAVPAEGKTLLTCLLGASLAKSGKRTLIIDSDLRNPSMHKQFGIPNTDGLAQVLRGETPATAAVRHLAGTTLSLMPAGETDVWTIQAMTAESIREVIEPFRDEYDYILIDSCPVMLVSDALVVGSAADAAILVARSGVSREGIAQEAHDKLRAVGIPVFGAVVNGVTVRPRYYSRAYNYIRDVPASTRPEVATAP